LAPRNVRKKDGQDNDGNGRAVDDGAPAAAQKVSDEKEQGERHACVGADQNQGTSEAAGDYRRKRSKRRLEDKGSKREKKGLSRSLRHDRTAAVPQPQKNEEHGQDGQADRHAASPGQVGR